MSPQCKLLVSTKGRQRVGLVLGLNLRVSARGQRSLQFARRDFIRLSLPYLIAIYKPNRLAPNRELCYYFHVSHKHKYESVWNVL